MSKDVDKKYVLFSPIGNHDPFGFGKNENEVTEGPLLHIIRHYKPEAIILFLTKEMFGKEEKDNRYTTCIKKLFPEYNDSNIVIWEEGHNIENPQNFDEFIAPYGNIFERINNEYPDYEIIYNVSSGTPQMIASIILEAQNSNMSVKAIQVESPERSANFRDKYFDGAWEYIEENKIGNRCVEPHLNVFKQSHLKSQISALLDNYEYGAAINLLEKSNIKELFSKNVLNLLYHCFYRLNLNIKKAKDYYDLPIENKLFEYFYTIKIKQKKGELTDFALKFTPILTELLEKFTDKSLKILTDGKVGISEILLEKEENGKIIFYITRQRIENFDKNFGTEILKKLDEKFRGKDNSGRDNCKDKTGKFNDCFMNTTTLKFICEYIRNKKYNDGKDTSKDAQTYNKVLNLFGSFVELEKSIRNTTAHEMVGFDEDSFKKLALYSSSKLLHNLELILSNEHNFPLGKFIYDEINDEIKKLL